MYKALIIITLFNNIAAITDFDKDGITDENDNCIRIPNSDQKKNNITDLYGMACTRTGCHPACFNGCIKKNNIMSCTTPYANDRYLTCERCSIGYRSINHTPMSGCILGKKESPCCSLRDTFINKVPIIRDPNSLIDGRTVQTNTANECAMKCCNNISCKIWAWEKDRISNIYMCGIFRYASTSYKLTDKDANGKKFVNLQSGFIIRLI
jgi:hypothetical protein